MRRHVWRKVLKNFQGSSFFEYKNGIFAACAVFVSGLFSSRRAVSLRSIDCYWSRRWYITPELRAWECFLLAARGCAPDGAWRPFWFSEKVRVRLVMPADLRA